MWETDGKIVRGKIVEVDSRDPDGVEIARKVNRGDTLYVEFLGGHFQLAHGGDRLRTPHNSGIGALVIVTDQGGRRRQVATVIPGKDDDAFRLPVQEDISRLRLLIHDSIHRDNSGSVRCRVWVE